VFDTLNDGAKYAEDRQVLAEAALQHALLMSLVPQLLHVTACYLKPSSSS
jgi:hypothetical protein